MLLRIRLRVSEGQTAPAECGVFYVGSGLGDVEANVKRWTGRFEGGGKFSRPSKKVSAPHVDSLEKMWRKGF